MELFKVLDSLMPGVEWSLSNDDLSTLEIHTEGITMPTEKQIKDEIKRLENLEKSKSAVKAALLERLGITADEATLLLQ